MIPLLIAAGAAGIGSAIAGAVGSGNAAAAQQKQAREAMALQRQMYDQGRADNQPWLDAGRSSLSDLMRQMQSGGFDTKMDASQLANDPGYQFRMAEGQKALERSAAARGGLNSGGFMKGLARYSQDYGANEFQNAWSRNQSENQGRFGRLAQVAGMGQGAAQGMSAAGANYGNSMANLYGAMGNAQSAGAMGQANAISGGLQTIGNMATIGAMGGFGGGGGGGAGGMQIPQQGYQSATLPGRSFNFGLQGGGY